MLSIVLPSLAKGQTFFKGVLLEKSGSAISKISITKGEGDDLATTDSAGKFSFQVPATDVFTFFGYDGDNKVFGYRIDLKNRNPKLNDTIYRGEGMDIIRVVEITVSSKTIGIELDPQKLSQVPAIGGVESIIKTLAGVTSNNELSSQYNVRGGNFDENLVYVNDIEIYRPQLIHSGQQEGLSFINPDMVKSLKFSAGGFEAQYGDKMSSVLDIEYKQPDSFAVSATAGILTNSLAVQGKRKKISAIFGMRYYNNSLLTRSLDVRGAYRMTFADAQTQINWRFAKHWQIEFLGNLAINRFALYPTSRRTEFGTVQQAYQLEVFMAGAENMNYDYGLGALTIKHQRGARQEYKWILSATGSNELEQFDVEGAYNLSLLDRDLGSKTFGKPQRTLGYGYYLDHGRNRFQSGMFNFSHIGTLGKTGDRSVTKYGVRINREEIADRYREWLYNDSNGYNIPPFGSATDSIILTDPVNASNTLSSYRGSAYVQNRYRLSKERNIWLGLGVRAQYWTVNKEVIVTPRANLSWEPNKRKNIYLPDSLKKNDVVLRLAAGAYYQPGFYRELRDFDGKLNKNIKAQRSWHFVSGMDRYFTMWDRRFKLATEVYYKTMSNLNPYLYDNIRIRYYANNSSRGYAWGVDNRLNGEFIKGLESWFSLGVMQTKERITYTNENGEKVETAWLRRPTDRRVNFSALFQDQFSGNPSIRVNLNLIIGTGIPYYLNGKARYSTTPNTLPPYRRLDIGFSKVFISRSKGIKMKKFDIPRIQEAWISLDVFNILAINNVIAYTWVQDIENNTYGVPEYLTNRRLNLRLHVEF